MLTSTARLTAGCVIKPYSKMRATALASRLRNVATLTTSPVRLPSRFPCCARFVVPAAALRDVHASAGTGVPSPQGPGDLPDGPESAVPGIKDRGNPGGPKQQAMSNTTPGGAGSAADGAGGYAEGEEEHASADPPEQHDAEPSAHAPTGGMLGTCARTLMCTRTNRLAFDGPGAWRATAAPDATAAYCTGCSILVRTW